jgi:hypothetical protein
VGYGGHDDTDRQEEGRQNSTRFASQTVADEPKGKHANDTRAILGQVEQMQGLLSVQADDEGIGELRLSCNIQVVRIDRREKQ